MSGVTLRKITDNNPLFNRPNGSYVGKINKYMDTWEGPVSDTIREDLPKNDLQALDNYFWLSSNDPWLQSGVTFC